MAEELQHLIDRIQKEAIGNAEAEANRIVSQAREKAAGMIRDAEAKARARLEKADEDAKVFVERSTRTLEQSARDLLITVGQGVENILTDIVDESVEQAMPVSVLQQMLLRIAEAYVAKEGAESRIEFLISEEDQAEIIRFFADQYRQHLVRGVNIHTDNGVLKGFRVAIREDHVYHDFTKPAIAEALSNFLRGHLSEIVHRAAREADDGGAPGDERAPPSGGRG
jgi:V/A-type H+-transporting ATPase subunit E